MPLPFFVVGPTAVGKTGVAIAVAERCGAEIVNADAFQLYSGLDLLTAKPTLAELSRVPHHLIGTVPLAETFSVARFQQEAQGCLDALARRQRPAIVVGGSGMYVKALTHGLSPLPPAQPALRAELDVLDPETLLGRLRTLDPISADVIDGKNKRRLVRAIEVCLLTGRRFSEFRDRWYSPAEPAVKAGVFLVRSKADLDARIKRRVEFMFAHGVIEEVRAVDTGLVSETALQMIGWRELQAYLRGELDRKSCMEKIEIATRRYAKRQITWFRGENVFEEIALSDGANPSAVIDMVCRRLMAQHSTL